jgi:hypothetical protein
MNDTHENAISDPLARRRFGEMMTVNEAAQARGVTRAAIWNLIRRGRLHVEMIFGRALVYRTEIEALQARADRSRPQHKGLPSSVTEVAK